MDTTGPQTTESERNYTTSPPQGGSTPTRWKSFCRDHIRHPHDAIDLIRDHLDAEAAHLGIELPDTLNLDGGWHYTRSSDTGKADQKQGYKVDLFLRNDIQWPSIILNNFKDGSTTVRAKSVIWDRFSGQWIAPAPRKHREVIQTGPTEAEKHAAAAGLAQMAWDAAEPCQSHDYLTRKGIQPHCSRVATRDMSGRCYSTNGAKWVTGNVHKGDLLLPMFDADDRLINVQRIFWGRDKATGLMGWQKLGLIGGNTVGVSLVLEGNDAEVIVAEGFATAATIHEVTGMTVVVGFNSGNLPRAAQIHGATLAAADNDLSLAGERAALKTGLPFLMPPEVGSDWNDHATKHGPDATRQALMDALRQARLPMYPTASTVSRIDLEGPYAEWLEALGAASDHKEAASFAWSIAIRMVREIPAQTTVLRLIESLRMAAPAGLMNPQTLSRIRIFLEWCCESSRRAMLSEISVTNGLGHQYSTTGSLDFSSIRDGVNVIRAPMGHGKTKQIGHPLAQWARTAGPNGTRATFVAMCHRRSLVREQARIFHCVHYEDVTQESQANVFELAVCLPSIAATKFKHIMAGVEVLFIDEVVQVIDTLASKVKCADGKTMPEVHALLVEIIRRARRVVVADAGLNDRTIRFLEQCRPNERFNIIDVPTKKSDMSVDFVCSTRAVEVAAEVAMVRAAAGERLWIGVAERRSAEILYEKISRHPDLRVLLVTGENTERKEQAEFLLNPDQHSLRYDVVIHTSSISSGVSIEHQGLERHFHRGMFVANSNILIPQDAIQMMRRVRYLKQWDVIVAADRKAGVASTEVRNAQAFETALMGGIVGELSGFDRLINGIKAAHSGCRVNFANALWWMLEGHGFTVQRGEEWAGTSLSDIKLELHEREVAGIVSARDIADTEAENIRRGGAKTEADLFALKRHQIARDMQATEVTGDLVELWDGGRFPQRVRCFAAMGGRVVRSSREFDGHLTRIPLGKARANVLGLVFEGFDIGPGVRLSTTDANTIIDRMIRYGRVLNALGLVPSKYATTLQNEKAKRPAYPFKEVTDLLKRVGLKTRRINGGNGPSNAQMGLNHVRGYAPSERKSGASGQPDVGRTYYLQIDPEAWDRMSSWCDYLHPDEERESIQPDVFAGGQDIQPEAQTIPSHSDAGDLWSGGYTDDYVQDDDPDYVEWLLHRVEEYATGESTDDEPVLPDEAGPDVMWGSEEASFVAGMLAGARRLEADPWYSSDEDIDIDAFILDLLEDARDEVGAGQFISEVRSLLGRHRIQPDVPTQ